MEESEIKVNGQERVGGGGEGRGCGVGVCNSG